MKVVEELARVMHETYERLAPKFGWETQKKSRVEWADVPLENRNLMVAVIGEVFTPEAVAALRKEIQETEAVKLERVKTLKKVISEMRGFFVSPGSNPGKRLMEMVEQWEKQLNS